jgi:hypothetical protein
MTHDAAWFGPNTGQVERFLAAARTLTAEQAADLVAEQRRVLQERPEAHVAAIRAIVAAAFDSGRQDRMKTAEAVGRAAVGAFPELAGRDLVVGLVGRAAEALVVVDLVPAAILAPMFAAWNAVRHDAVF